MSHVLHEHANDFLFSFSRLLKTFIIKTPASLSRWRPFHQLHCAFFLVLRSLFASVCTLPRPYLSNRLGQVICDVNSLESGGGILSRWIPEAVTQRRAELVVCQQFRWVGMVSQLNYPRFGGHLKPTTSGWAWHQVLGNSDREKGDTLDFRELPHEQNQSSMSQFVPIWEVTITHLGLQSNHHPSYPHSSIHSLMRAVTFSLVSAEFGFWLGRNFSGPLFWQSKSGFKPSIQGHNLGWSMLNVHFLCDGEVTHYNLYWFLR